MAVAVQRLRRIFETLRRRLAPGGVAVLQVITIRPDRFAAYTRGPDFIQRYIFPGGMLPTVPSPVDLLSDVLRGRFRGRLDHVGPDAASRMTSG